MEETTAEFKPKSEMDAWKDFMPPEDFVPEWKKQLRALDREQARKKLADRVLFTVIGFAAATLLSMMPNTMAHRLILLAVLTAIAAWGWITSLLNKLKAVELDNKLNEEVRIEPLVKQEPPAAATTEQKA